MNIKELKALIANIPNNTPIVGIMADDFDNEASAEELDDSAYDVNVDEVHGKLYIILG